MDPEARDRAVALIASIDRLRPAWIVWDPHLTGSLALPRGDLAALADYARHLEAERDRLARELTAYTDVEG